jgi:excisionase family DNA binding protein
MDKLLLRPQEAAELLGISRAKMYDLIGRGEIPSVKIGNSTRVPHKALEQRIDELLAERAQQRDETVG